MASTSGNPCSQGYNSRLAWNFRTPTFTTGQHCAGVSSTFRHLRRQAWWPLLVAILGNLEWARGVQVTHSRDLPRHLVRPGMRLVEMATGPHYEARENGGGLYGSATVVGHDEEASKERWDGNADTHIKSLCDAGDNGSSTAEQRGPSGYSKLETRSFNRPDWRDVTIVSSFLTTLYLYNLRPLLSPSLLHAGNFCQPTSIRIVLRHSFNR